MFLWYKLYVPGRSMISALMESEIEVVPVFLSTVTPGKFPTL